MIKIAEIPELIKDLGKIRKLRKIKKLNIKDCIRYERIQKHKVECVFELHRINIRTKEHIRIEKSNYEYYKARIVRKWKDKFRGY